MTSYPMRSHLSSFLSSRSFNFFHPYFALHIHVLLSFSSPHLLVLTPPITSSGLLHHPCLTTLLSETPRPYFDLAHSSVFINKIPHPCYSLPSSVLSLHEICHPCISSSQFVLTHYPDIFPQTSFPSLPLS